MSIYRRPVRTSSGVVALAKTASAETVWGDSVATHGGTGGGFSTIFPVQSFQIGAPIAPLGLGRMVPDLAANADPNTGIVIVLDGGQLVIGGTSVVSPLYSDLFAALGKKLGFVTPTLWNLSWHDFNCWKTARFMYETRWEVFSKEFELGFWYRLGLVKLSATPKLREHAQTGTCLSYDAFCRVATATERRRQRPPRARRDWGTD
jgi:hypothetical protein